VIRSFFLLPSTKSAFAVAIKKIKTLSLYQQAVNFCGAVNLIALSAVLFAAVGKRKGGVRIIKLK
jgi:hypothetical protein